MPSAQREAFLLREIRGLSYSQLSAELSLSAPSVRSLLVRARTRLRHRLRDVTAAFGGAPWIQALVRLVGGGDGASPLPAATKAAAVGIGALALVGGGDLARVQHHASSTPRHTAAQHRAHARVRLAAQLGRRPGRAERGPAWPRPAPLGSRTVARPRRRLPPVGLRSVRIAIERGQRSLRHALGQRVLRKWARRLERHDGSSHGVHRRTRRRGQQHRQRQHRDRLRPGRPEWRLLGRRLPGSTDGSGSTTTTTRVWTAVAWTAAARTAAALSGPGG